jgi:biopolymer transport protein ExbD
MEEREFDYINVIPLVDVMLVLLTIVLTTSSFIAGGAISVSLPKVSERGAPVPKQIVLAIDQNGALYFNSDGVTILELGSRIGGLERETPILVRADRSVALQIVVDVLDLLNSRGFKAVAIQTERRE